ncbi:MAG: hypothetical protein PHT07_22020 [Paludibacter sp.]|nr:hypothetical protein [Paludibacter sp.]
MKAFTLTVALILMTLGTNLSAQKYSNYDGHGHTLNIGLGIGGYSGYYGYIGHTLPVLNVNYEFGVTKNFTLAPFITLYSYSDPNYITYVTPVGVKGTFYLDQLLHAGRNWNFYVAGSLGAAIVTTTWNDNYYGDRSYYRSVDPLYLDFHVGAEYLFTRNVGAFVDLSTGISTIGIAIH